MKQYFTSDGRMGRLQYFVAVVVINFVFGVAGAAFMGLFSALGDSSGAVIGLVFYSVFLLAGSVLSIMQGIKRLHDMEKSGWMLLLGIVPLANIYLAIIMLFKKGTDGANKYGEDPAPVQELTAV